MHAVHAMRVASKGRRRFLYANLAKVTQLAKIIVGNNAIDWCRTSLARVLRETDNISLGRPLRRTIKQSTRRDNEHQPHTIATLGIYILAAYIYAKAQRVCSASQPKFARYIHMFRFFPTFPTRIFHSSILLACLHRNRTFESSIYSRPNSPKSKIDLLNNTTAFEPCSIYYRFVVYTVLYLMLQK